MMCNVSWTKYSFLAVLFASGLISWKLQSVENTAAVKNKPGTLVAHCIGRYMIDLPHTAEYLGSTDEYGALAIETEKMDLDAYTEDLAKFGERLRQTKHVKSPNLLLDVKGKRPDAIFFTYWRHQSSNAAIYIAGYHWIDGLRYRLATDADPEMAQEGGLYVRDVVTRLRGRGNGIPTTDGFCIREAIIDDKRDNSFESTSVTFRLKDMPDVQIQVSTSVNEGPPPETLLSRKPSAFSALSLLGAAVGGIRTIAEGDRVIGDIPGQEWLIRASNDYKFQSHLFTWEAQGKARSVMSPQIRIELRTAAYGGGVAPGEPSLNDEQARHLWDRILSTLRLRPTGAGQSQTAGTVPAAPGR